MDYRVQQILTSLESNYQLEITSSRLARKVGLTPEHLCRIFKADTGLTLAKYLKRLRFEQAKLLLETTNLSTKQIMLRVGLKDESHFRRDFKAAFGLTPREYREAYHKENFTSE